MTINIADNSPRISYTVAQGATQTSFTVPFEFFDNADLNVYIDGTLKTITTHYTVSGGDGSTGTVSMSVTGGTGGSTVVITRDIELERTTDFPVSGAFNIVALNTELDRLIAVAADLDDLAGRGVKLSDFDTAATLTLPLAADRVNKVLAFNSAGDTLISQELGVWKGDWAASTAYVERDLVRDTSDGSIYIVTSAHTSSGSAPLDTNTNSSKYSVIFDVGAMLVNTISMSGNLTVNGNTTLGNASSDTITTTGTVSNLRMSSTNVTDILDEDNMSSNSAASLATQQSIKAYVDSQVGASDTLTEILGNGNTTSGTNIQLTTTDEVQFRDTALKISSSADGQLDIDADTEVEITAPTVDINASTEVNISGDLTVDTNTLHVDSSNNRVGIKTTSPDNELTVIGTGFFGASTAGVGLSNSGANLAVISGQTPSGTYKPLKISSTDPSSNYLYFDTTSGIGINNDSPSSFNSKLVIGSTSGSNTMSIASGTTGVGNIHFADGTSGDALDAGYIRYHHQYDRLVLGTASATVEPLRITSSGSVGIKVSGDPSTELEVNGTITATGFASTGNMTFGDNDKAIFGASTNLEIYASGGYSYIDEVGANNLNIRTNGANIGIYDTANSQYMAKFTTSGAAELYHNGSAKLATTSTGIDVTGTVTADGLEIDKGGIGETASFSGDDASGARALQIISSTTTNTGDTHSINAQSSTGIVKLSTSNNTQRLAVFPSGDIAFYEDTGTTAKFFWDASAESLGIGTSSPSRPLQVTDGTSDGTGGFKIESYLPTLEMDDISGGGTSFILQHDGTSTLFKHDTTERMRIDGSGNVGIGASSPSSHLHVKSTSDNIVATRVSTNSVDALFQSIESASLAQIGTAGSHAFTFFTANQERLRIASDGNVGIGVTNPTGFYANRLVVSAGYADGITIAADNTTDVNFISFDDVGSASTIGKGWLGYYHNGDAMVFGANGSERMRIDSSGRLLLNTTVEGFTDYADDFTISNTSGRSGMTIRSGTTSQGSIFFSDVNSNSDAGGYAGYVTYDHNSNRLAFGTSGSERMRIANSGHVGINNTDPASTGSRLVVQGDAGSNAVFIKGNTGSGTSWGLGVNAGSTSADASFRVYDKDGSNSYLYVRGDGNVGIGTAAPSSFTTYRYLDIVGGATTTGGVLQLRTSDFSTNFQAYSSSVGGILGTTTNHSLIFTTNNSTRVVINSGGNVAVGGTSFNAYQDGSNQYEFNIYNNGQFAASVNNAVVGYINRQNGDGELLSFRKDGSTVGSIGSQGGLYCYMGSSSNTDAYTAWADGVFKPSTSTGTNNDNAMDLGNVSSRWDDIYATNGTIQTSDRNEKQDIAELTDAEQRVAVAAKGLLRKFRWKDAVAEKGDKARTHFGIIAQDLQAAFAAEGLDAGDYAMFISSTWTDEETGEERTRMGVRYSELLAFIIAAI